jgi:hypothetical protein
MVHSPSCTHRRSGCIRGHCRWETSEICEGGRESNASSVHRTPPGDHDSRWARAPQYRHDMLRRHHHLQVAQPCDVGGSRRAATPTPRTQLWSVGGMLHTSPRQVPYTMAVEISEKLSGMLIDFGNSSPAAFRSIESLRLNRCYRVRFKPPGGSNALCSLTIIENDALQMFVFLHEKNPLVGGTLQKLHLRYSSTHFNRIPSKKFHPTLQGCTTLRTLWLVLLGHPGLAVWIWVGMTFNKLVMQNRIWRCRILKVVRRQAKRRKA